MTSGKSDQYPRELSEFVRDALRKIMPHLEQLHRNSAHWNALKSSGGRVELIAPAYEEGERITDAFGKELLHAPRASVGVIVDPYPSANWEHPCWIVLVAHPSGEILVSREADVPLAESERHRLFSIGPVPPL